MDSNHRRRMPTDLQSAPFSHSGIPPNGAGKGGRTPLTSLEGWCTADMPYPHYRSKSSCTTSVKMVPTKGVEPLSLAAHGPEPCASANSATSAKTSNTSENLIQSRFLFL